MDIKQSKRIIDRIINRRPKILVLGDVMLDKYIFGKVQRISPEAPVPILDYKSEKQVLGGAGNVAHNLVNLGVDVGIASLIGKDINGDQAKIFFQTIKVSTDNLFQIFDVITTLKTRFISNGNQLFRLDNDSTGLINYNFELFSQKILSHLNGFDCLIISDYNKGVCSESLVQSVINKSREIGIPVFIDPKGPSWSKYANGTCLTPNTREVEEKLGVKLKDDLSFENAANLIRKNYKLYSCLITRGADGMTYCDGSDVIHQKVGEQEVFDVSGAGDTVIASIAAGYSSGLNLADLIDFSSFVSSKVVSHVGTTPFFPRMLEN